MERAIDIYRMRLTIDSCFVKYVMPSSGIILAIYNTLYWVCQIIPLDARTYSTKNIKNFGFTVLL